MTRINRSLRYTTAQVRRMTDGLLPHDVDPYWHHPGRIRTARQLPLPIDLPRNQVVTAAVIESIDRAAR